MAGHKKKERLDSLVYARGLAEGLDRARSLIMAGLVIVDDHLADKPGALVSPDAPIRLRDEACPYVSRGGLKLEKPLELFQVPVAGKVCLDVGASTGGFTDCLLQHGAARVYAVDVGYGQLAWQLQQDSRVVRLDRTNITKLQPADLDPPADLAVIDASFTSLTRLLDPVLGLLVPAGELLCLVKPQFEARRGAAAQGGIVRDEKHYQEALHSVVLTMRSAGLFVSGIVESPIHGAKGNREFFIYARKQGGESGAGNRMDI
jgi:23S rRNA (cytidine1920-2'-O)/16S rRNA (cytidine1409-2'-O)-methyltransferase